MEKITERCTGCGACVQLCPKHCISMVSDEEGFLTARVNQETCIDCGLCARRCPQNRADLLHDTAQRTWAARLKDEDMLYKSASGGAFAGMALHVIRQGGVVFGVRWDEAYHARHGMAEAEEDLLPMLSSKYVQSDTGDTYAQVKAQLHEGRMVLYSGTGCQIAGLRSYLNKDYENLVTVDLVCHGVTSPLLFEKYIEVLTKKHGAKIEEYDFRDKNGGWGLGYKYKYKYKYKYGISSLDPYYRHFLAGDAYRRCCYACKYCRTERTGDITIADYWGIEQFHPEFYDAKGVSLVMVNSAKGDSVWQEVAHGFHTLESKLEYAVVKNGNLRNPTKLNAEKRAHIYDGIQDLSPEEYFATRLPIHPSLKDRVKDIMPMRLKLALKKLAWRMKSLKRNR